MLRFACFFKYIEPENEAKYFIAQCYGKKYTKIKLQGRTQCVVPYFYAVYAFTGIFPL